MTNMLLCLITLSPMSYTYCNEFKNLSTFAQCTFTKIGLSH